MTSREMWRNTCIMFGVMWFFFGMFVWPLLFFSAVSFMMLMIPVGVNDENIPQYTRKHNPEAWKRNTH